MTHVASPGLAQNSSRCWYSWAKIPSYRNGCPGRLSHSTVDGSCGGFAPVRCSQSYESIDITFRLTKVLMADEW